MLAKVHNFLELSIEFQLQSFLKIGLFHVLTALIQFFNALSALCVEHLQNGPRLGYREVATNHE